MSEHACTCEHPKQEPGYFCGPNCGAHIGTRHPKWKQVEPGHVIPAGQPYRVEWPERALPSHRQRAIESVSGDGFEYTGWFDGLGADLFVDSSWKPPLVLPTKPTWGIVRHNHGNNVPSPLLTKAERHDYKSEFLGNRYGLRTSRGTIPANQITDFIPLTDEQVARIEATR